MSENHQSTWRVDCNFLGGNIIVERIEGNTIYVHQDLRDTEGDWFYWYFRVRDAAGQNLRVTFTGSDVIGVRGPAVSLDRGWNWKWLGTDCVDGQSFTYTVPENCNEVRFSGTMPYLQTNMQRFLEPYRRHPNYQENVLCVSNGGRPVERMRIGRLDGKCAYRVLLTARHHSCETIASYALEGIMAAVFADDELGDWLRENVEFLIVPFMDKDGVEDGDQGKNRKPHDHNRDYQECIYPEVKALTEFVPRWDGGRFCLALDLHCPWIRGEYNEWIYFVGSESDRIWKETETFSEILQANNKGTLPFRRENNLPFGKSWNNVSGSATCTNWTRTLSNIKLATSIEIPYANASGAEVNAESARSLGRDLASAIVEYLRL